MQHEGQDQTSRGTLPSLIQTGEGFLLKFELCLGLSWLTLPCLVLGSACALVFACACLALACPWLCFCFFCLCLCWNKARLNDDFLVRAPEASARNLRTPLATHEQLDKEDGVNITGYAT